VSEELASVREVVDLSPPQALDEAEYFLVEQGYVVVNRTATTLTVEREGSEDAAQGEGAPRLVVMTIPQTEGGVKIKVRGNDRGGILEQQTRWIEWENKLPKRMAAPKVQVRVVPMRQSGRRAPRLSWNTIVLVSALVAFVVVIALVGWTISGASRPDDATEVVQALEDEGMPIGQSKSYTAENDPNELLGRPGQYTSKIIFKDTRLKPDPIASEFDVQNGGSVEVFENEDDAIRRQDYLEGITQSFAPFNEYAYREGTVLLRLSHRLTPQQADEYEAALQDAL
jgi:hypothetical protein